MEAIEQALPATDGLACLKVIMKDGALVRNSSGEAPVRNRTVPASFQYQAGRERGVQSGGRLG
jgi:hypothetical protein